MKKKYFLIGGLCAAMAACLVTACAKTTDPFDESKFGGSSNDESNELVTDKKIKIDGKLDEDCWQNQKEFDFTYQNVRVRVKTVFGDLGFYVGYEVEDEQVYAVEGRDVWKGSSVEMYVDRGDATKKSERTFQYRLGALDQWETLYGYETKEDSWSMTYLPIYGKTQVQGITNSGNTEGMTAEIFVRWDALGYDFTKADFTAPETVKIMPVYNQSSGAEMDSARTYWVNNGGDLGNPMHYWLFDKDGFVDADAEGAKIGDSSYGRAKSAGWDVGREAEGVVRSKTAGDQYIFFKGIYETDYAVTALVEYKDALEYWANNLYWQKDPYPKAGLILASDTTIQAYLLNYDSEHRHGVGEGMFFKKGNPEPRDVWQLYGFKSFDTELPAGATNGKVRLTGVKSGRYLLVFAGTEETAKFGGTFVGMQEIAETAGNAAPGFYTLGCEVEFSDYAVTTDADVITELTGSVLSVLKLDQKNGGALVVGQLGYRIGETATVQVSCYENYKLTSIKVNGQEKISELTEDGELTVEMSKNEMTVTPVFERVNDTRLVEGCLHYIEKNARPKSVSVLITGETPDGGKIFLQVNPSATDENNRAEYYANLPSGAYQARVLVDGIYRASKDFEVKGENVTLSDIETPLNWVFVGDVETKKDGSVIVRGYNQYREVANRSATNYFAMTAYHYRDDGNFTTEGTWSTGGFGVKVEGVVYRFHAMRFNAEEMYFYIEVDGGASQEYRGIYHSISGTGAPLTMDVFYMNGEFRILFDGTTEYTVNRDNTPNAALHPLFDTNKSKRVGLITVGEDMVFEDYDFAFNQNETEAMYNRLAKGTVVLPENVEGLQITSSVQGESATGTQVTLTFTLESGYAITSLTVNGKDMLQSIRNNQLTFTLCGGENVVAATAGKFEVYLVEGTLGYASGLYATGDKVTISSGTFVGTLSGGNWTIELPDGTHEIKFESERFETVTCSATVSGGDVTVNPKVEFTTIKFNGEFTRDGNAILVPAGAWKGVYLAGVNASDGVYLETKLKRNDGSSSNGGWGTGGFTVEKGGSRFDIFVMNGNGNAFVYIVSETTWTRVEYKNIPFDYAATGTEIELAIAYSGNEIYLMLGGRTIFHADADNFKRGTAGRDGGEPDFSHYENLLFKKSAGETSQIGLSVIDCGQSAIRFYDYAYVLGADAENSFNAEMKGSVKLPAVMPDGLTITAENGNLAGLIGETVVLSFDLTEGKTISSLTLDGNDVLSKYSGGKLAIVLTAGEHTLEVQTEGVSVYAVTGTLGYAAGLYKAGDSVTVSSGTFTGTVSGGNWTIKLPDGTHEVTFESSRFVSKTVTVTVNGAAASVSEKIEFSQIKFTEDSRYERDGNDVLTPTQYGWDNTAYFAGIDARNGIRIDAHMQRTDGNNFVNSTWQTGGFTFKINNTKFYLFFKMENGAAVVTLGDNVSWTWRQDCVVYPRNVTGTGASVDMSVVFLDSKIYLLIANDAVGVYDVSDTTLATVSGAIEAGFFTAYDSPAPIRFSNFGYSAVTELPNDFKLNRPQATIFADNNGTVVYDDGSIGIGTTTHWLKDPTGAGEFLTSDAQGNFVISYTLQRMDGYFEQEGSWDTPYFQIYIGGTEYTFFAMRENASTTVFYLNSATKNLEFRVPYEYRGTGAPLTISVAFSSDDHLLHILLGGTHYAFEVANAEGSSFEMLYAENGKILGFRCATYAGVVSDISYAVTKAEVDTELQKWGAATKVSVNA